MELNLSHHAVIAQVRQSILTELLEKAKTDPLVAKELAHFLAFEPLDVPFHSFINITDRTGYDLGFVRLSSPVVDLNNPKPTRTTLRLHGRKAYLKQWLRFLVMKPFLGLLRRSLTHQEELRALVVTRTK